MITFSRGMRRRIGVGLAGLSAAGLALFVAGPPAAAVNELVTGKFDTNFAFAGACADDVIVCAEGTTTGNLKGTFTLNVTEIKPGAPGTDVLLFIGDASVETKDGTLRCSNSGAFQITGDGVLMSLCVVLPGTGTGKWATASGYFQVNGHGSLGTGTATGDYKGYIVQQ